MYEDLQSSALPLCHGAAAERADLLAEPGQQGQGAYAAGRSGRARRRRDNPVAPIVSAARNAYKTGAGRSAWHGPLPGNTTDSAIDRLTMAESPTRTPKATTPGKTGASEATPPK